MSEIKLNIEAIRMNMKLTRPQMADRLGITIDRYNRLAVGESKYERTFSTSGVSRRGVEGATHLYGSFEW